MSTSNDIIVHSYATAKRLMQMFTHDLKPHEYLHRTNEKANCIAWLLGHLTLSHRHTLQRLGVSDLPELPDGFEKRFSRDGGAPEAKDFGDVSLLWPTFEKHHDLLAGFARNASQDVLSEKVEARLPIFSTKGELLNFMALHAMMHAGQISLIRRSLGYPPVV